MQIAPRDNDWKLTCVLKFDYNYVTHQPGVKGVVRKSAAQCINQQQDHTGCEYKLKIGWAYHSLHSRLMIHRIKNFNLQVRIV